jgi:hypothetical protein
VLWVSGASLISVTLFAQQVILVRFHSNILNQDRGLGVYLPSQYDSTKTYPVMYVLDGRSQGDHLAKKFDSLAAAEVVPRTILVAIANMNEENRRMQLIPPFMKTDSVDGPYGTADTFLSFFESELFPFIESKFPVSKVRLFAGNSRGGLLVMYSLLYKAEMFQARFCFSSPFWRQDNILVSKVEEFLRTKPSLRSFFFMSVGDRETRNMKGGFERMTAAFKEHASKGFVWSAYQTLGVDHQDNAQNSASVGISRWGEFVGK